jgi:DNA-binding NarL/FixJ family response regulator
VGTRQAPHLVPRLVLCEDDPVMQRWCLRLATDAGVEVVGTTSRWAQALELVVDQEADALLVDIATVGRLGVRLIRAVRRLAPACEVFVLSPFRSIDAAALEAGATAIADPSDPRPVATALKRLGAGATPVS